MRAFRHSSLNDLGNRAPSVPTNRRRTIGVMLILPLLLPSHLCPRSSAQTRPLEHKNNCLQAANTPKHVWLDVPYFNQLDNTLMSFRSSKVTAIASILAFYGVQPKLSSRNLPDELISHVQTYGDIVEDRAIAQALRKDYGMHVKFTTNATWCDVMESLRNGIPVVTVGEFGRMGGHVVAIVGYTPTHVLVHDPYGDAMSKWSDRDGRNMHYPIQDFIHTISPESKNNPTNIWAYFIWP